MPRFFFDLHQGHTSLDDVGQELPDVEAAIGEAVRSLPSIAAEVIPEGAAQQAFAIVVRDETSRPIYTATLSFYGTRL